MLQLTWVVVYEAYFAGENTEVTSVMCVAVTPSWKKYEVCGLDPRQHLR